MRDRDVQSRIAVMPAALHKLELDRASACCWNHCPVPNIAVPPGALFPCGGMSGEAVQEALHE